MLGIFTLTFNTETKEASHVGNIEVSEALNLLTQYLIGMEAKKLAEAEKGKAEGEQLSE